MFKYKNSDFSHIQGSFNENLSLNKEVSQICDQLKIYFTTDHESENFEFILDLFLQLENFECNDEMSTCFNTCNFQTVLIQIIKLYKSYDEYLCEKIESAISLSVNLILSAISFSNQFCFKVLICNFISITNLIIDNISEGDQTEFLETIHIILTEFPN
jgi:hypothetical protein